MSEHKLFLWTLKAKLLHVHIEDLFGPAEEIPDFLILVIEGLTHAHVL
jgi:hypothetical protein